MKKMVLFLLGLTPFLLGRTLDWLLQRIWLPLNLAAVGILALWGLLGYLFYNTTNGFRETVFWLNLPALFVLILLGVQELALHAYWTNPVGGWTQLFYLPCLSLGFTLTTWSHTVFPAYCASFLLLVAAAALGSWIKKRRAG